MPNPTSLLVALTAAFAALPEAQAAIYTKNSPVLQVNARNYDKLIAKSNYTSVSLSPHRSLLTIATYTS